MRTFSSRDGMPAGWRMPHTASTAGRHRASSSVRASRSARSWPAVRRTRATVCRLRKMIDRPNQVLVEAMADRLAPQRPAPLEMHRHLGSTYISGERGDHLGIRRTHLR